MGCCLSKKDPTLASPPAPFPSNEPQKPTNFLANVENKKKVAATETEKVEIKKKQEQQQKQQADEVKSSAKEEPIGSQQHRKSNDRRQPESKCPPDSDGLGRCSPISPDPSSDNGGKAVKVDNGGNLLGIGGGGMVMVRTSSCTKEEVDAILIQCGRLSRSSSGKGSMSCENRSGKKRSHDFDCENVGQLGAEEDNHDEEERRGARRQSRSGSHRRRTTPSRSRERDSSQQERSANGGSGRRVSRSPGRRSESSGGGVVNGESASARGKNNRPGKMVSVPATVSSLSNEKGTGNSSKGDATANGSAKRMPEKRNVGEGGGTARSRGTASPRSQSPARGIGADKVANESNNQMQPQQQQAPSLSRSSSRKAENSPMRRTPLDEIDMNSLPFQPLPNKPIVNNSSSKAQQHKNKDIVEEAMAVKKHVIPASPNKCVDTSKVASHGTHRRTRSRGGEANETAKINSCLVTNTLPMVTQPPTHNKEEQSKSTAYDAVVTPIVISGADSLILPQTLTRSRSSRRSRDLDIDGEALVNPNATSNYNSLLLQDIHNFHQTNANANTNTNTSIPFSLPPCLNKTCSILEAVADLNSSTGSNLSAAAAFTKVKQKSAVANLNNNFCFSANPAAEEEEDPLVVETEVNASDDLMAPSIHKYVTVRKKGVDDDDDEQQESSGSNSFVGNNQLNNWAPSSSSWEPNSAADSTDCLSSLRSNTKLVEERSGHELDIENNRGNDKGGGPRKTTTSSIKNRRQLSSSSSKQQSTTRVGAGKGGGGLRAVASVVTVAASST